MKRIAAKLRATLAPRASEPGTLVPAPGRYVPGVKQAILGAATYVPGLHARLFRGTGGTGSARYCYSVWLRHAVAAHQAGVWRDPRTVAELGPGDSLGIGLSALLSGVESYRAFDVVALAPVARNLQVFDELVALFRARAPIQRPDEFPSVGPKLPDYGFPHALFDEARLEAALAPERVAALRAELARVDKGPEHIRYVAPWSSATQVEPGTVDLIFSQAVMEHIDDLADAYHAMALWLAPGGVVSHQIDFSCHGTAAEWNGHWTYPAPVWRLIRGRRPYLLNRQPWGTHRDLLVKHGFQIAHIGLRSEPSALRSRQLAAEFRGMSDADLVTRGAYVLAQR